MSKLKYLFISMLLAVFCATVNAQTPAQWRMTVKMTSADEGVITIKALVEPGWHIYGTKMPADGPVATSFDFSECKGVKLQGKMSASPAVVVGFDNFFGKELSWWDCDVTFKQKFKVVSRQDAIVKCTVKFMGCNDERCSKPSTINLKRNLPE